MPDRPVETREQARESFAQLVGRFLARVMYLERQKKAAEAAAKLADPAEKEQ